MWFLKSLYRSLYDITWLREQRAVHVGKALGFFTLVILVVSLFRFGPIAFFLVPRGLDKAVVAVAEIPDFTAQVQDGKLQVENLPQPFSYLVDGEKSDLLIYIDTVSTSTPAVEDLAKGKENTGVVLITRDDAMFYDPDSQHTEAETYADLPNGTSLSKTEVVNLVNKVHGARAWISVALQVFAFIVQWIFEIMSVLFWSLVVWIVARFRKNGWGYGEVVQVALFAITLPLILNSVLMWLALPLSLVKAVVLLTLLYLVVLAPRTEAPVLPVEAPKE